MLIACTLIKTSAQCLVMLQFLSVFVLDRSTGHIGCMLAHGRTNWSMGAWSVFPTKIIL
jgi:hypothetical protein